MKQRFSVLALLLALLLTVGCMRVSVEPNPPPKPEVSLPPEPSTPSMQMVRPTVPPTEAAMKAELTRVRDTCLLFLDLSALLPNNFPDPTLEEYAAMHAAVAELGFTVDSIDRNMSNIEPVLALVKAHEAKEDAWVTIYSVRNFGILAETFVTANGKATRTLSGLDFTDTEPPSLDPPYEITKFSLTEQGHFFYESSDPELSDVSGGYCVLPHEERLRELCRTYIDPVGYSAGGTCIVNWGANNLSGLNWEFLFESLIWHQEGKWLSSLDGVTPVPGDEGRFYVPAAQVEALLQQYYPVSIETLHALKRYDAAKNAYAWRGFAGGGYSPTPEVTAVVENKDGSLTLTVGALALEWGKEYSFTSTVTVLPKADGTFQYLSCVTDSDRKSWAND